MSLFGAMRMFIIGGSTDERRARPVRAGEDLPPVRPGAWGVWAQSQARQDAGEAGAAPGPAPAPAPAPVGPVRVVGPSVRPDGGASRARDGARTRDAGRSQPGIEAL
jgi:hypothetical protein